MCICTCLMRDDMITVVNRAVVFVIFKLCINRNQMPTLLKYYSTCVYRKFVNMTVKVAQCHKFLFLKIKGSVTNDCPVLLVCQSYFSPLSVTVILPKLSIFY